MFTSQSWCRALLPIALRLFLCLALFCLALLDKQLEKQKSTQKESKIDKQCWHAALLLRSWSMKLQILNRREFQKLFALEFLFLQRKTDKPPIKSFTLSQRAADVAFIYRHAAYQGHKTKKRCRISKSKQSRVFWRELPHYVAPVSSVSL